MTLSCKPTGNADAANLMYPVSTDYVVSFNLRQTGWNSAGPVHGMWEIEVQLLQATKFSISHLSFETSVFLGRPPGCPPVI
jgi:hypothetical protein